MTGLNNFKPEKMTEAIIFENNTCPHCGGILTIDKDIRYICNNCDFICPIYHTINDLDNKSPVYDSSISQFIQQFGEPIQDRRNQMLSKLIQ